MSALNGRELRWRPSTRRRHVSIDGSFSGRYWRDTECQWSASGAAIRLFTGWSVVAWNRPHA